MVQKTGFNLTISSDYLRYKFLIFTLELYSFGTFDSFSRLMYSQLAITRNAL